MWTYRIKYSKLGRIRFISHLDCMRALIRTLNRANVPLAYSGGFNPRPKISMGPALPLGYESRCELADILLERGFTTTTLHQRIAAELPAGLDLLEIDRVLPSMPSLSGASSTCYVIELPWGLTIDEAMLHLDKFADRDGVFVERVRKGRSKRVDVKEFLSDARLETESGSAWLWVEINMYEKGSCSASEVAQAVFDLPSDRAKGLRMVRTDIRFRGRVQES